jgi:diadenylate cyclase
MTEILWIFSQVNLRSLLDILIVAAIFYGLLLLMRGTRGIQLMRGVIFLIIIIVLASNLLSLTAFSWLLKNTLPALLVAVPVVFQPELRRALERLGRGGGLINRTPPETRVVAITQSVSRAAKTLSDLRHGALMVLERETSLQENVETGVVMDAQLSAELLLAIFQPTSTLHDGAVLLRGDRIVAAACALPLSDSIRLERGLGLRHRAAMGVTEESDALAVVVSEETGIISVARRGRMIRHLDDVRLRKILQVFLMEERPERPRWLSRLIGGRKE